MKLNVGDHSWRSWLDATSTVAITVLAVVLTWTALKSSPGSASPGSRPAPKVRPAAPSLPAQPVSLDGAELRGRKDAPITMIEYADYQCPYCGAFARNTLPALASAYVDKGTLLFAFQNLPLTAIHQFAQSAASAAVCAGRQQKFWEMHDSLFANQKALDQPAILARVGSLGLDRKAFDACLKDTAIADVGGDIVRGEALDVRGTPTFYFGVLLPTGRVKVLNTLSGAAPVTQFETIIDDLLGVLRGKH
jgi:protein-disulfide isomerase